MRTARRSIGTRYIVGMHITRRVGKEDTHESSRYVVRVRFPKGLNDTEQELADMSNEHAVLLEHVAIST